MKRAITIAAMLLALAACGSPEPDAGATLNVYNWSDYIDPAILEEIRGALRGIGYAGG